MAELLAWLAVIIATMFIVWGIIIGVSVNTMLAWGLVTFFGLGFALACIYALVDWFSDFLGNMEDKWK